MWLAGGRHVSPSDNINRTSRAATPPGGSRAHERVLRELEACPQFRRQRDDDSSLKTGRRRSGGEAARSSGRGAPHLRPPCTAPRVYQSRYAVAPVCRSTFSRFTSELLTTMISAMPAPSWNFDIPDLNRFVPQSFKPEAPGGYERHLPSHPPGALIFLITFVDRAC